MRIVHIFLVIMQIILDNMQSIHYNMARMRIEGELRDYYENHSPQIQI